MICYFSQINTKITSLSQFSLDIECYRNDPIFNFSPFAKVDAHENETEFILAKKYPLIQVKKKPSVKTATELVIPFPLYKKLLEQVYCFLNEFLHIFDSAKLENLSKEVYHYLKIANGDMSHFSSCRTLIQKSIIKIHPCLKLYNIKFAEVRSRMFKFMRTSIQYSYQKDLLYSPNNVLHFILHWNEMFLFNSLDKDQNRHKNMDIFKSRTIYIFILYYKNF